MNDACQFRCNARQIGSTDMHERIIDQSDAVVANRGNIEVAELSKPIVVLHGRQWRGAGERENDDVGLQREQFFTIKEIGRAHV